MAGTHTIAQGCDPYAAGYGITGVSGAWSTARYYDSVFRYWRWALSYHSHLTARQGLLDPLEYGYEMDLTGAAALLPDPYREPPRSLLPGMTQAAPEEGTPPEPPSGTITALIGIGPAPRGRRRNA